MIRIVGFAGVAHAGKSTAATVLHEYLVSTTPAYTATRLAYADRVKDVCASLFLEVPSKYWYSPALKSMPLAKLQGWTPRTIMQHVGTQMRAVDRDVFVKQVGVYLREHAGRARHVFIIDDVRYKNEEALIHVHGGVVLRVHRKGAGLKGEEAEHSSEREIPQLRCDAEITNNKSRKDLLKQILPVLNGDTHV